MGYYCTSGGLNHNTNQASVQFASIVKISELINEGIIIAMVWAKNAVRDRSKKALSPLLKENNHRGFRHCQEQTPRVLLSKCFLLLKK